MAQFSVHKNKNPKSRDAYPYLIDIQSDLLSELSTRVVAPLTKLTSLRRKSIRDLTPVVEVEGVKFLILTPQLAGIAAKELGQIVGNVSAQRDEIVAAVDFLVTGV